ncbi:MAG: type II toxin-antitoxin system MqsA family antitoxin [Coriobacteriia bacterium]|nr:type II toxin-antitoxin system MqsA family antitoxin [Coriobacteriia bacterium]
MALSIETNCPVCGRAAVVRTDAAVEVETPEHAVTVTGFMHDRCEACGEEFFAAAQLDQMLQTAADTVRLDQQLLTGAEVREIRLALGLTQRDLERLLGVGPKSVGRWERGMYAQGKPCDVLLRLLAAHPELVAETGFIAAEGRGPYGRARGAE